MDFASSVSEWRPKLIRTAVLMGAGLDDAEDIVQTSLTKAFQNWERVSHADNSEAYMYRILINTLKDRRRYTSRFGRTVDVTEVEVGTLDPHVTDGLALRIAISKLHRGHREILVLRYYCDLSEKDASRILRLPIGTIKSRTTRAVIALGKTFKSVEDFDNEYR